MWTPRRVLLLLTGTLLFAGVYGVYSSALGWIDGLPQLPSRMLEPARGEFRPPDRPILPTVQLLREAFGKDCAEENTSVYANQFTFKSGDSWVVVATGRVPNPEGKSVTLSPFSVAVFGKPRPPHLRAAGEVPEVSTFHADKAVFEFDRPVSGPVDMQKANLIRLELVSEPEATTDDKRRGLVHITNNQRSADPNRALVLRTPGPVFYRDPKKAGPKAAGPDIWTDAAIEVVDRQNLPRPYGEPAPPTAPTRGRDLRDEPGVVPDILAGRRLPPPTVTAVGMRVFLDDADKSAPKKGSAGFSGVRRLELGEKVLLNLWVDARQTVVSTSAGDTPAGTANPLGTRDEPEAAAAVVGGLFTAAQTVRRLDRALLQVETLGPFAYDAEKNTARFDVIPQADPNVLNDVQVTRMPPRGKPQKLFSQVLEIEFHGPPTGGKGLEQPPAGAKDAGPAGPSFKQLHAWAYTPGRLISVESEEERLTAFGFDLVHDQAKNATILKGAPLTAIRQNEPRSDGKPAGGNVLTAGAAGRPAGLTISTVTTETKQGPKRTNSAVIDGAGTMKLFDPNAGASTIEATWGTSLAHTKEQVEQREVDLLTFTGAAMFEDKKAEFWLKGNVLKLWLDRGGQPGASQPLPHRVQALGDVSSHSPEYAIERSDHLNVQFEEGTFQPTRPPVTVVAAPPPPLPQPAAANPAAPPPAAGVAAAPPPKEEPRPKPPMKLRARVINTWVVRAAVKNDQEGLDRPGTKMPGISPNDPVTKASGGGTKYHLKRASCEGSETLNGQPAPLVHQDPADPARHPRGLDIYGATLHLDQTPDGGVMTVTGEGNRPGEVHHEGMSVVGPKVVIDQLRNSLFVEGTGSMVLPANSSLSGGEPQKAPPAANVKAGADGPPPAPVVIHWRDHMHFQGAVKSAEFIGRVRATQGESSVSCHTLQVLFDKPVLFNAARAGGMGGDPRGGAKIDRVRCHPAPADAPDEPAGAYHVAFMEVVREPGGRLAKWQYLKAAELELAARATDPSGKDPYQLVTATGPGEVRLWQYGEKDVARAPGAAPAPKAPPPASKAAEGEMKLTIVTFTGRMVGKDKGKLYQEAVFYSEQQGGVPIEVVHASATDPGANVPKANPPAGTVTLTCADRLVVSTHRRDDAPAAQRLDAFGNVFIRTDEYDGWGEQVNSDGRYVTLHGAGNALARIANRFTSSLQSGEKITYDRATGNFNILRSAGVTIPNQGR